jgi:hypothetical protein
MTTSIYMKWHFLVSVVNFATQTSPVIQIMFRYKWETVWSSETSAHIYQTTWCRNPEDHDSYSCAYLVNYIGMNRGLRECWEIHRNAVFFVLALVRNSDHSGIVAVCKYVQYLVVFPKGRAATHQCSPGSRSGVTQFPLLVAVTKSGNNMSR